MARCRSLHVCPRRDCTSPCAFTLPCNLSSSLSLSLSIFLDNDSGVMLRFLCLYLCLSLSFSCARALSRPPTPRFSALSARFRHRFSIVDLASSAADASISPQSRGNPFPDLVTTENHSELREITIASEPRRTTQPRFDTAAATARRIEVKIR